MNRLGFLKCDDNTLYVMIRTGILIVFFVFRSFDFVRFGGIFLEALDVNVARVCGYTVCDSFNAKIVFSLVHAPRESYDSARIKSSFVYIVLFLMMLLVGFCGWRRSENDDEMMIRCQTNISNMIIYIII